MMLRFPVLVGNPANAIGSWRCSSRSFGVWRLFDAFIAAGVRASCTMNAKMALKRPAVIDAALEQGFELIPHNYEQGELLCHLQHKPDEEKRVIEQTLTIYERATGRKAQGWLSSSLRSTTNTPAILVENGLKFWCDLMNDDQPFMIANPRRWETPAVLSDRRPRDNCERRRRAKRNSIPLHASQPGRTAWTS
jgi:peptidoglycan/xylan/chitin deacetylase (PgdA/CDA1 family)